MNLGGPAHHVALLSAQPEPEKYESTLVAGVVGRGEEEYEVSEVAVHRLRTLGPDIRPVEDLKALISIVRLIRAERPDIVETHTSKAGMLGRLACLLAGRRRPIVIHTFHGHVLRGYFGRRKTRLFLSIERTLARSTDLLIAVSEATAKELVELGVAPRSKFAVVPLGLELDDFLALDPAPGGPLREEAGVEAGEALFTFTGRLVPIKRPELMLQALALAREGGAPVRVAVVGDGELRPSLEERARQLGCADSVHFLGYRRDMPAIAAAADAALLTSDNEGTPVALIEAAAAGRPAVATDVGGVRDIVVPGTGLLAPAGEAAALAELMTRLAADPEERLRMGAEARRHVRERFSAERLLSRMDEIYSRLLAGRNW